MGQYNQSTSAPPRDVKPLDKKWITTGIDKDAVDWAENFAQSIEDVSSSQLRKFFGNVKSIQIDLLSNTKEERLASLISQIHLLKPKLAYAAARDKKLVEFEKQMKFAINAVGDSPNNFKSHYFNFVSLLEAIVAYHKKYEKKKN